MIIFGFVSGALTLLTPGILVMLIQNAILFEKFGRTKKEHQTNTLIFVLLAFVFIAFLLPKIMTNAEVMSSFSNDKRVYSLLFFTFLVIIIWISLSFLNRFKFLVQGGYLTGLRVLALIYFSFKFFIISAVNPIILGLLIQKKAIYATTISYAIGITIPVLVLMLVLSSKYEKMKDKKWWKPTQIITLIISLVVLIVDFITT